MRIRHVRKLAAGSNVSGNICPRIADGVRVGRGMSGSKRPGYLYSSWPAGRTLPLAVHAYQCFGQAVGASIVARLDEEDGGLGTAFDAACIHSA